ncbi:MAG: peptidoglycan editing factor PgeF [Gammaproteobacteria bacterium]|nr:peptidoglycan editing factor PgeF [Gammaproteobacteria bacterium]
MTSGLMFPDWPAPAPVYAASTTREGGFSTGPYARFNLATHVGDAPNTVAANHARLVEILSLPESPRWLNQVHGSGVVMLDGNEPELPKADASSTRHAGRVCAVLTADCLPVLFCDAAGTQVAAAHAGWRGLVGGVLEATAATFSAPAGELLAWLGPAIGPTAFEVRDEVRRAFCAADPDADQAFVANGPGHWLADLCQLARQRLARAGITQVYGGEHCTHREAENFYSFRRDDTSGRMASLIWLGR